jgi:hypothetical protein
VRDNVAVGRGMTIIDKHGLREGAEPRRVRFVVAEAGTVGASERRGWERVPEAQKLLCRSRALFR